MSGWYLLLQKYFKCTGSLREREMCKCFNSFFFFSGRNRKNSVTMRIIFHKKKSI